MDGAIEETGAAGESLVSARASLAEGYAAARMDKVRRDTLRAWEFPHCAVRIDKNTMGFVVAPPAEDDDALGEWAARVATQAVRAKVRRALVGGPERQRRVLCDALDLAGIEVISEPRAGSGSPSIFGIPWLRRAKR